MNVSKSFKSRLIALAMVSMAIAIAISPATAATVSTTFAVTATVQATCIVSASAMGFGTYIPTAASTSSSTITVTCTNNTPYNVGLNAGTTTGSTVTNRLMAGTGSTTLSYQLTQDGAHATNWGNSTGSWVGGTGSGSSQTLTVYGQVAAGQYVAPGSYSDTITATVNY